MDLNLTCTELKGHWRLFVLVSSFYILFLVTCARSPQSAFEFTLFSSVVPYRIVMPVFRLLGLLSKFLLPESRKVVEVSFGKGISVAIVAFCTLIRAV